MLIFNGKKESEIILLDTKEKILEKKVRPSLAVISVGEDSSSRLFIKNKKKAAKRIGIAVHYYKFGAAAKEDEIIRKIEELNEDSSTNGIIVQLPLPKTLNSERIIEKIDIKKDVDGFHKENRELLDTGRNPHFESPFVKSISIALKSAIGDPKNKKILAVVNSKIFGEVLKNYFKKEGIKINYIIKKKHYFLDIRSKLKSADVVITSCGCVRQLKGDMIKQGAILIDGGITLLANGKVAGDVDMKSVEDKAAFLTPVPGGIGPLTIALLLKNVYLAAKK